MSPKSIVSLLPFGPDLIDALACNHKEISEYADGGNVLEAPYLLELLLEFLLVTLVLLSRLRHLLNRRLERFEEFFGRLRPEKEKLALNTINPDKNVPRTQDLE